jgi:hypothetical protein
MIDGIEKWRDIKGFEGWYQVSNLGRVRSVDRSIEQWSMYGHTIKRNIKGKIISATDNGNGYLIVGLKKNQMGKNKYVHRLVAEAFIEKPNGCDVVNHIDYDKKNNASSNLEWVTQLENIRYSAPNMRKEKAARLPASGEKYITKKGNRWRLNIQRESIRIDRKFATLEEAIEAREAIMGDEKHHAG